MPGFIIYKPERIVEVDGHKRVIAKHEQWYATEGRDFQCSCAHIKKADLKPGKLRVGNHDFIITPATFLDEYKRIRRDAQIITRKDLGFMIGFCGLNKDSVVVESGGGSGAATIMLAKVCKKIYSFELDPEHLAVVKENLAKLNIKNAVAVQGNIYETKTIKVKNADFLLLDVPEPWKAIPTAKKIVKLGGYIVAYTPSIIQAKQFLQHLPEDFMHERTTEIIDRDWKMKGEAVRPVTADIGHTAFLTVVRRIL